MRCALMISLLSGVVAGCASSAARSVKTDAAPVARAATGESQPAQPASGPPRGTLVFGSDQGLYQVAADGSGTRLVSAGPALHPRRLDAEHVVVLNVAGNSSVDRGGRIERVSILDGSRNLLATLPPFACRGRNEDDAPSLEVQAPNDLELAPDGRTLCMDLMDRNANMAELSLWLTIDAAELLVVDSLIVRPGAASFKVEGEILR